MAKHNELGKWGEDYAAQMLIQKGYSILARNFKASGHELDIIAQQGDLLIIIEVKTRTSNYMCEPTLAITKKKMRNIATATMAFIRTLPKVLYDRIEIRFDVITIVMRDAKTGFPTVEHYEDAFHITRDMVGSIIV